MLIHVAIIFCRYLSCVNLLRMLVFSSCSEIPSIQELTKPELSKLGIIFSILSQHSMAYFIFHSHAEA